MISDSFNFGQEVLLVDGGQRLGREQKNVPSGNSCHSLGPLFLRHVELLLHHGAEGGREAGPPLGVVLAGLGFQDGHDRGVDRGHLKETEIQLEQVFIGTVMGAPTVVDGATGPKC